MARGAMLPIIRAANAQIAGNSPAPADLEIALRQNPPISGLKCWNGFKSRGCRPYGSQNHPFIAAAGSGNWKWIAAACEMESREGNFGRENGSCSGLYYGMIVECKAGALKYLAGDDYQAVRLALRSNIAWDVLTAVPVARLKDEIHYSNETEWANNKSKRLPLSPTVAVSGMRWTAVKRGAGLTSQDSHSETLRAVLANPPKYGLTTEETLLIRQVIYEADPVAAKTVSSWMFGTIDQPEVQWAWTLRRTTMGAESICHGPSPNPHKPCRTYTSIEQGIERGTGTWIGTVGLWRGMQPAARDAKKGWAHDYKVRISDKDVIASCRAGEARITRLSGKTLWQVEIRGMEVEFKTGD